MSQDVSIIRDLDSFASKKKFVKIKYQSLIL